MLKSIIAAIAVLPLGMAKKRWGTITSEPEMPFDDRTPQSCSMWYNNDGSASCEFIVYETFTDISSFVKWACASHAIRPF